MEGYLFGKEEFHQINQNCKFGGHSDVIGQENSDTLLGSWFQGPKSLLFLTTHIVCVERSISDALQTNSIGTDEQLCQKFKHLSYENRNKWHRIFAGGLIADDSWHVIRARSLETYGVLHSVTFVESNRTQDFTPHTIQFQSNPPSRNYQLLHSGIYGPDTPCLCRTFCIRKERRPHDAGNFYARIYS